MSSARDAITVYYNSACPVCNAGTTYRKRRMAGCAVRRRDVHADVQACREIDAGREHMRERLHAVDEHGRVTVGAEAFATIWRHSPGEWWKARLISLPVIRRAVTDNCSLTPINDQGVSSRITKARKVVASARRICAARGNASMIRPETIHTSRTMRLLAA
ncbi:MAG: DUF393 domain-containing protein [Gammaproteobacteria bacterium]|nr:DUF393 domain-containing protein [Gammaproteobacteria bacterium]